MIGIRSRSPARGLRRTKGGIFRGITWAARRSFLTSDRAQGTVRAITTQS